MSQLLDNMCSPCNSLITRPSTIYNTSNYQIGQQIDDTYVLKNYHVIDDYIKFNYIYYIYISWLYWFWCIVKFLILWAYNIDYQNLSFFTYARAHTYTHIYIGVTNESFSFLILRKSQVHKTYYNHLVKLVMTYAFWFYYTIIIFFFFFSNLNVHVRDQWLWIM